jgi:hypothetical protein
MGNIICTFDLENNYSDDIDPWKEGNILSATAYSCAIYLPHYTIKYPWPTIVFGRDMILNVKHEANWEYIHAQK